MALVALAVAPRVMESRPGIAAGPMATQVATEMMMVHPASGQMFRVPGVVLGPLGTSLAELPRAVLPPKS